MLRVVHLSTTELNGGAALATQRLHLSLPAQGIRSTMFVASRGSEDREVIEFHPAAGCSRAFNRFLLRGARMLQRLSLRASKHAFMTHDWSLLGGSLERKLPVADLYHLHWTSDLLDFRMLPRLAKRAPLVWTFHDMNAFTGGCHYTQGCTRFTANCGACPLIPSDDPGDFTHAVIERKRAALEQVPEDRLVVIAPSRWMAAETQRSALFGRFQVEIIPNGIDLQAFHPLPRPELRRQYGFTPEDRVILFVADRLDDQRKGWRELEQAIAKIAHLPRLRILTLGEGDTDRMQAPIFRHLGRLSDPAKICEAYNLADVFAIPSLEDNFPNTVLESLASGTPVVGFATGGVADAVEDGVSGLLAPTGNVGEFAKYLALLLTDEELRKGMSRAARERAVANYGLERQAARCAALYHRLRADDQPEQELLGAPLWVAADQPANA